MQKTKHINTAQQQCNNPDVHKIYEIWGYLMLPQVTSQLDSLTKLQT